jgi:hypothetical protein
VNPVVDFTMGWNKSLANLIEGSPTMASLPRHEEETRNAPKLVYRVDCRNPGCGCQFEVTITPRNASLLSGTFTCPRCNRHGGILRPFGKLGERLFAAKLVFKAANLADAPRYEEDDVFSEVANSRLN